MGNAERVTIIRGKQPVLLVCPHGADDDFTGAVTQSCAEMLDCYAVINNGFERAEKVDVLKDKANCNRIDHITEDDVLKEEYFDHIISFKDQILKKNSYALVFHIHGFGDQVDKAVGTNIDIIIGWGEGEKFNSYSCAKWRRNCLIHHAAQKFDGLIAVGKGGGKYAARHVNNVNQLFKKHAVHADKRVDSMQLEIARRLRVDESGARWTGLNLATVILELVESNGYDKDVQVIQI